MRVDQDQLPNHLELLPKSETCPVFLEEGAVVFSKKKWTPILYKYERTEKFYSHNKKQAIQLGGGW